MIKLILSSIISLALSFVLGQTSGPFYGPAVGNSPAIHIQSCTGTTSTGSSSSISATCSSIGAGHLLWITIISGNSVSPSSTTLSGDSGTLHADLTNLSYNSGVEHLSTLYVLSTSGGGTTLTFNFGAGSIGYGLVMIDEVSCPVVATFDTSDAGNTGSGTAITSNNITPAGPGELIVGGMGTGSNTRTQTANSPFTLGANLANYSAGNEYLLQQIPGAAIDAAFTLSGSSSWGAHVAAFHC